ncbi:MAG: hypothetical protein RMN25_12975, partial [Anaerolineae bacterium]|nr:hypothetical protein [Thermoflexales bacterium]MDW8408685.1 hypothetical protein [Anaerolineae bacterium]
MNISADLTFVRIAGEQFDEYLNTEVLFYPIGSVAGMAMPQLTIGSWLETVWRLRAVQGSLDLAQRQVLDQAEAEVRRVRRLWSELYRNKAQREFKSRLDSWSWYLDELFSPGAGLSQKGAGYVEQVHMRFKLELLRQDVSQPSEQVM